MNFDCLLVILDFSLLRRLGLSKAEGEAMDGKFTLCLDLLQCVGITGGDAAGVLGHLSEFLGLASNTPLTVILVVEDPVAGVVGAEAVGNDAQLDFQRWMRVCQCLQVLEDAGPAFPRDPAEAVVDLEEHRLVWPVALQGLIQVPVVQQSLFVEDIQLEPLQHLALQRLGTRAGPSAGELCLGDLDVLLEQLLLGGDVGVLVDHQSRLEVRQRACRADEASARADVDQEEVVGEEGVRLALEVLVVALEPPYRVGDSLAGGFGHVLVAGELQILGAQA